MVLAVAVSEEVRCEMDAMCDARDVCWIRCPLVGSGSARPPLPLPGPAILTS